MTRLYILSFLNVHVATWPLQKTAREISQALCTFRCPFHQNDTSEPKIGILGNLTRVCQAESALALCKVCAKNRAADFAGLSNFT